MLTDTIQSGYQMALCALSVLILVAGEGRMKRTMAVILADMGCGLLLAPPWPSEGFAWLFICVDAIALTAICWHPAGKWQSVIGLTYLMQIAVHFGRIFLGDNADINAYWWGLSITAIVQLALLGYWWCRGQLVGSRDNDKASPDPGHAGLAR